MRNRVHPTGLEERDAILHTPLGKDAEGSQPSPGGQCTCLLLLCVPAHTDAKVRQDHSER